jgi:hypothetical protein
MDESKTEQHLTRTAFQQKMEPGMRKMMEMALVESGIKPEDTDKYQAVTRRIFRAAIAATTAFMKDKTGASARFLVQQGSEALNKAAMKLYPSETDVAAKQDALLGPDTDE